MKILLISNNLSGKDGWSRYTLDLANEFNKRGDDVLCVSNQASSQDSILEKVVLEDPLKYIVNPFQSYASAKKLKKIITEFCPDIIHIIAEPYLHMVPFLSKENRSIKFFLTAHGSYSFIPRVVDGLFKYFIALILTKKSFKLLSGIFTVSNFTKDYLLSETSKARFKDLPQVLTVTNGIDSTNYSLSRSTKTHNNKTKKILFVGGIKVRKGLLEVLRAIVEYKKLAFSKFQFDIIGAYNKNDHYYIELIEFIRKYELDDYISFKGVLDQVQLRKYYAESDLFIMLSKNYQDHFEGFGLVYLEANAEGVPSIGSMRSGAESAIVDNKTGFLVDPNNAKEVAMKIDMVLNKGMISSEDCIAWARKNDIKNKASAIKEIYES